MYYNRIIVYGPSGSGKTYFSTKLAHSILYTHSIEDEFRLVQKNNTDFNITINQLKEINSWLSFTGGASKVIVVDDACCMTDAATAYFSSVIDSLRNNLFIILNYSISIKIPRNLFYSYYKFKLCKKSFLEFCVIFQLFNLDISNLYLLRLYNFTNGDINISKRIFHYSLSLYDVNVLDLVARRKFLSQLQNLFYYNKHDITFFLKLTGLFLSSMKDFFYYSNNYVKCLRIYLNTTFNSKLLLLFIDQINNLLH